MKNFVINIIAFYLLWTAGQECYSLIFDVPELSLLGPDPLPEVEQPIVMENDPSLATNNEADTKNNEAEQPRTYTNATRRVVIFSVIVIFCFIKICNE